jgi:uncharacterized membrane protein
MQNKKITDIFGFLFEFLAVCGLLFHLLIILGAWNLLPKLIPVHFDFAGRVDAWGDKSDILLLFGLSVLFYAGLTWLGRYPQKFNYPWEINENNAERQYSLARNFIKVIKLESVWLFAIISLRMIGIALGTASGLGYLFVPLVIGITSATIIGYFIVASRSAFDDAR